MQRQCVAIDLKSFYASVECAKLGVDALDTHLVVADASRTDKTICLAVSPSLKAYGIGGRCRLFEAKAAVKAINEERRRRAPNHRFLGKSCSAKELGDDPSLELDFRIAAPNMSHYMEVSGQIYGIYLKYVAPDDIHVYSIDEVFMDVTHYLGMFRMTAKELAMAMIKDILEQTGITATAGIGTNLYLCKVAMDILAKKIPADENGVRMAQLDETSYRRLLWSHRPITDFWRIGRGYRDRLAGLGLYTMGDVARFSLSNEETLYKTFGVNAELLIDHAWGYEPCSMKDIKAYKPKSGGFSTGQILPCPYKADKARLVLKEMVDSMAMSLVEKGYAADSISVYIGYDSDWPESYKGPIVRDYYGRLVPKGSHGSAKLGASTTSSQVLIKAGVGVFDRIVEKELLVKRLGIGVECKDKGLKVQPSLFDFGKEYTQLHATEEAYRMDNGKISNDKERKQLEVALALKKRFGRNVILRGMDLEEGATARERNGQIGGHKA